MSHMNDFGEIVDNYEEWLELSGAEDSEETRGWYDCPEGEEYSYIQDHPEWWEKF